MNYIKKEALSKLSSVKEHKYIIEVSGMSTAVEKSVKTLEKLISVVPKDSYYWEDVVSNSVYDLAYLLVDARDEYDRILSDAYYENENRHLFRDVDDTEFQMKYHV